MVKRNNNIFSILFFMQMTESHAVAVQSADVTSTPPNGGVGNGREYLGLFRRVFRPVAAIQGDIVFTLHPDDSRAFVLSDHRRGRQVTDQ